MEIKKPQKIIIIFLTLWIIFLGWGIIKTTLKLSKQKTLAGESLQQPPGISDVTGEEMPGRTITTSGQKPDISQLALQEMQEMPPILARTFKAKRTDFTDLLPVMGTVKGETEIELRFEINGVIKSINFREGEKIKKGDLVAFLNPKDAQLKLEYRENKLASAQASYQSSLKTLEIQQKLYEAGAIIKSKLEEAALECESAKFHLETVKAEKDLAQNDLTKTNFYSPIDGVMGPRDAEEGEFVTPQDKVATLFEIDNVLVEVGVVERDINKIKVDQKAKVFVDAYPDITFEGTVDNIFPVVEGKSRTLTAKIKVNNANRLLLPGMFCRAEISIIDLKDAILVPSPSLIPAGGKTILIPVIPAQSLNIDEDEIKTGIVQTRQVQVGYMTTDYAQITEGVDEDDLVVIETQGELQDNARVRVTSIEEISF